MTYRVYLRLPDQRVADKTVTPSPPIAEAAFRDLLRREELYGQKVAAVLSLDNRQLEYVRFDQGPIDPDREVRLFHDE